MKSSACASSSPNVMLVTLLSKTLELGFHGNCSDNYLLAFNTCDESGYNEPIFERNSKSVVVLWVTKGSTEPFNKPIN